MGEAEPEMLGSLLAYTFCPRANTPWERVTSHAALLLSELDSEPYSWSALERLETMSFGVEAFLEEKAEENITRPHSAYI